MSRHRGLVFEVEDAYHEMEAGENNDDDYDEGLRFYSFSFINSIFLFRGPSI
jgi:hypothetical protein